MSFAFDLETAIGLALLAFFGVNVWRAGTRNPVGTGQLQKQLTTIGSRVGKVEAALNGCASSSDLDKLRGELKEMEAKVASSGEVIALEGQIAVVNTRMAGMEKLVERTDAGVARIEGYFLQRGIDR